MKSAASFLYLLTLALWTGGMAMFTFIVTPAIFRSYGRDQAGEIVGRLFPGYFVFCLVVSALALALVFLVGTDRTARAFRVSLFLLAAAVVINAGILFSLHPRAVALKRQVATFERSAPDTPERKEFRRLHGISAALNLALLLDGAALLLLSRSLLRQD